MQADLDLFTWADGRTIIDASEIFKDRAAEVIADKLINHARGNRPIRRDGKVIKLPERGKAA